MKILYDKKTSRSTFENGDNYGSTYFAINCQILLHTHIFIASIGDIYMYDWNIHSLKHVFKLTSGIINDIRAFNSYLVCCTTKGKIFVLDYITSEKKYLSVFGMFSFSAYSLPAICIKEIVNNCKYEEDAQSFFAFFKLGNFLLINDLFDMQSLEYKTENKKPDKCPCKISMNAIDMSIPPPNKGHIKCKLDINQQSSANNTYFGYTNIEEPALINKNFLIITSDEKGTVYFLNHSERGMEMKCKLKIGSDKITQIVEFMDKFYCICANSLYKFDTNNKRRLFACGEVESLYVLGNNLYALISGALICVSDGGNSFFDKIVFGW